MKRMCFIVLAALAIIICVIAFKSLVGERQENFDGILIEKNIDNGEIL